MASQISNAFLEWQDSNVDSSLPERSDKGTILGKDDVGFNAITERVEKTAKRELSAGKTRDMPYIHNPEAPVRHQSPAHAGVHTRTTPARGKGWDVP